MSNFFNNLWKGLSIANAIGAIVTSVGIPHSIGDYLTLLTTAAPIADPKVTNQPGYLIVTKALSAISSAEQTGVTGTILTVPFVSHGTQRTLTINVS